MYVVAIIGPSGMVRYLKNRKLFSCIEDAKWYDHPSSARKARDGFMKKFGRMRVSQIFDPNDPEKEVDQ